MAEIYPTLARRIVSPMIYWQTGELARLRYLREFQRTEYLSEAEIRRLQLERLQRLLEHAYRRCPFYRARFDQAGLAPGDIRRLEDLSQLPILEKEDIQEHGERMVASGWPVADLVRNQTGGSTGQPITFYLNRDRLESRAAATMRHDSWAGWQAGHRQAVIWGAPRDQPSPRLRSRVRRWLLEPQLWLDTAEITEGRILEFHRRLASFRPRTVVAYAGAIALLARYFREQKLTPYQPHSIVTSAEVLTPEDREVVEQVFGCPVFNRYGSREVAVLASECEHHQGLHTMAEGLYIELVKEGRPAGPDEFGSVVVTDLLSLAMPLVRYRIGDVARWASGSCPCGRGLSRLEEIGGRVTNFLVGADGRLVSGVFLATYVVARRPSLGRVQIVQNRAGHVTYRIQVGSGFDTATDIPYLEQATARYLGEGASADHELVERIPLSPSGKMNFSLSSVPHGLGVVPVKTTLDIGH
jgi:phenylacetate-CoA ligase